jgi:CarboxypepD_reg-like domain/TonB-dependent Receptor Plug Domain
MYTKITVLMKIIRLFLTFLLLTFYSVSDAQITQTIRGIVLDKQAESPLVGAAVVVEGTNPILGAVSDENGNFAIKNVPTGRYQLKISFIGYNASTLPNIVVNAGKETILNIFLEEAVTKLEAVVVSGKVDKALTINELATISARQFNVEEVQRYSGGRNDVSRLAANFAGVATNNDSRNDIVIRGNSPTGVLWRLEGIPIPNPNHFSTLGTTGGPVSALNPNMIRNSDFLTSAFPSEYGNANAGVFDIGLRNGNKEKFEITAQLAAFSGMEAMVEGPLSIKGQKASGEGQIASGNKQKISKNGQNGSFVVAYRYSFVELAQKAGIDVGTAALPKYSDLTFNVDLGQTKLGKFSVFGIGGLSNIALVGAKLKETDFFADNLEDSYAKSKLGIIGLRHTILVDNNTYVRTVVSASHAGNTYNVYRDKGTELKRHNLDISDFVTTYSLSSFLNKKFNAQWSMRTGVLVQNMNMDIDTKSKNDNNIWIPVRTFGGGMTLSELYSQAQYKPTDKITINAGIHTQYLDINKRSVVEPRFAFNYRLKPNQTLSFGYGLHSQMQPMPALLEEERMANGSFQKTNLGLDFTKSHHFVVGYDVRIGTDWHGKVEFYDQILRGVPIESKRLSAYSILNQGADFDFYTPTSLVNKGSGKNIGMELTLEKFFSAGWYTLFTASIFDSKYKGSDGIERNTAFNSNHIANLLLGKEFKFGKTKQNKFTIDTKVTTAGGRYQTPIDLVASNWSGRQVRDETKAYSVQQTPYFRWDIKFGYTLNSSKKQFTQQFFLDFQNVTNHKNIFEERYSVTKNAVSKIYQIGFFPDLMWRFQF